MRRYALKEDGDEKGADLCIAAQGGANVPRDSQTVRVARM